MRVVSWISNLLAGCFSASMLLSEWWAIVSIPLAILGAIRHRCSWIMALKYLGGAIAYALLFHGSLWLNTRLSVPDRLSATLFWTGVLMTFIGGIKLFIRAVRDTWQRTNTIPAAAPIVSHIFGCPRCDQQLRVPTGQGLVRITCRSCGNIFEQLT